jgi:hypothetical protein
VKKTWWLFLTLVIVLTSCMGQGGDTSVQPCQKEYFEETSHIVRGEFLAAYCKATNPTLMYGYPITDAFQDPTTGLMIQYFQKARFELRPDALEGQRIKLTPLGQYLYVIGEQAPIPENTSTCRVFPETGYQVCDNFLIFFEANGGTAQFGYPISNLEIHNDRIVQYFQIARFEWHPEFPAVKRVILSDLGSQYFHVIRENVSKLAPLQDSNIIKSILTLKVRAFPLRPVTCVNGTQTVYIVVQDQRLLPVSNAQVTLLVRMPTGEENHYIVPILTDKNGITQYRFPFNSQTVGIVQIYVTVTHNTYKVQTVTSFRVWW